jgi:hypothetical protein
MRPATRHRLAGAALTSNVNKAKRTGLGEGTHTMGCVAGQGSTCCFQCLLFPQDLAAERWTEQDELMK